MSEPKLGRGFEQIAGQEPEASPEGIFDLSVEIAYTEQEVRQIEAGRIQPNPHQPRMKIKEESLLQP